MENILSELFDLLGDGSQSPAEAQAIREAEPHHRRLKELARDNAEVDAIWGAAVSVGAADGEASFCRGFRLGARLMLAALEDAPAL